MSTTATQSETPRQQAGRVRAGRKYKVLFIGPGPMPPRRDPRKCLQVHISEDCEGDWITKHWGYRKDLQGRSPTEVYDHLGSFRYHATFSDEIPRPLRMIWVMGYLLRKGLQLSRMRNGYDAMVTYGPFSFALVGWLLRLLTGARLVIEVPGPPTGGHAFEAGWVNRVKSRVARLYVPRLLRGADGLRLYYPTQLDELPRAKYPPTFVFPDLVPVSIIDPGSRGGRDRDGRYALFIGHPFERKGVDVLIEAFRAIGDRHPDLSLKIVGHCPDLAPWRRLAGDHPRISFLPGQPHEKAMELLNGCEFFVLPSRAEGVPRVLIEAMAARKPVIATGVNGIPYLIRDEEHGLLVPPDDAGALASRMESLLTDPELARRLADSGHDRIFEHFSEACYREGFRKMMETLAPGVARDR
ncbi:MAG: glycosyltransferase family 4 protein [Isosphaeraceae bacterium]